MLDIIIIIKKCHSPEPTEPLQSQTAIMRPLQTCPQYKECLRAGTGDKSSATASASFWSRSMPMVSGRKCMCEGDVYAHLLRDLHTSHT